MNQLEELKGFFIKLLTEARELDKKAKGTAHIAIDANIRLLEKVVVFISNSIKDGTIDMEKAKSTIKVLEEGVFEGVARKRQQSPITTKIITLANELKPGTFKQIDAEGIEPGYFSTRVHNLRALTEKNKPNGIPLNVKPKTSIIVDGEVKTGLFLVKLTKEQMSAEPKKRTSKS